LSSPISKTGPASTQSSPGSSASFSSSLERTGRDGFLSLRFKRDADRTVVARLRYTLPLQAQTAVAMPDGSAYLLLLNPTGGILGGDRLLSRIALDAGTHACLSTPSATRVYRALGAPSVQETWIDVGPGATLEYFPDHVIQHAESRFKQRLSVELSRGSRAILFDAFAAGRIAHGESWAFREFDSETRVFCAGKPLYLSRTKIDPPPCSSVNDAPQTPGAPALHPTSLGIAEGFGYVASLMILADGVENWPRVVAAMHATLATMPQIRAGASLLGAGGCVVRYLAASAGDLASATSTLWAAGRQSLLALPPFDLRKY
jgi:urease accessory protein